MGLFQVFSKFFIISLKKSSSTTVRNSVLPCLNEVNFCESDERMALGALNSAISGLEADSTWLDVIGNNIANVNTVAYKSSSVAFANQFSQALSSGSGDNVASETGGTNPQQIGAGTRVQSIQTNFAAGVIQQTGISTDISIQGSGFLVAKSGSNVYLTRAGNLTFDGNGNLVDSTGALIQGYNATLQYTKTTINSYSSAGPLPPAAGLVPAVITAGAYTLNNQDPANIGTIHIDPNMTMIPRASTQINLTGNLDAAQQANANGGVLNLNPNGQPTLPLGTTIDAGITGGFPVLNPAFMQLQGIGGPATATTSYGIKQTAQMTDSGAPGVIFGVNVDAIKAKAGNYAWEQQPPLPPANEMQQTVYDSTGNAHTITIQFYQVNDLGAGGINSASGPSQAAYAWYAFDTTGGQSVSTNNLIGGTGILEGNNSPLQGYDDGVTGQAEFGDLLFFNTDGSLASAGGGYGILANNAFGLAGSAILPEQAHLYIPVNNLETNFPLPTAPVSPQPPMGAEILRVTVNFGTWGVLGTGKRDGLTGDAQGSYQTVNGVNTYVPNSHVTGTQNGYADGSLQSLAFDSTGKIVGSFSNRQTADLAQVVVADVNNENGLNNVGNDHFQISASSGQNRVGLAGQNGFGSIQGGALEGSNVDLTVELSNMIVAQKGFDTNARMITTMSGVLQTLAQLGQ